VRIERPPVWPSNARRPAIRDALPREPPCSDIYEFRHGVLPSRFGKILRVGVSSVSAAAKRAVFVISSAASRSEGSSHMACADTCKFSSGRTLAAARVRVLHNSNAVGPDYFQVMGIPILQGRAFADRDRIGSPQIVILNENLARRLFGNTNPVGHVLRFSGQSRHDGCGHGAL
jgi:hypothetical protein